MKPQIPKVELKIEKESNTVRRKSDPKIKESSNVNNLLEFKEEPFQDENEDDEFKYKEESTWEATSK
jgi:hypothetical protein